MGAATPVDGGAGVRIRRNILTLPQFSMSRRGCVPQSAPGAGGFAQRYNRIPLPFPSCRHEIHDFIPFASLHRFPRPEALTMRVFGFAGWSGSGKTTLIEKVIPRLVSRGLTV